MLLISCKYLICERDTAGSTLISMMVDKKISSDSTPILLQRVKIYSFFFSTNFLLYEIRVIILKVNKKWNWIIIIQSHTNEKKAGAIWEREREEEWSRAIKTCVNFSMERDSKRNVGLKRYDEERKEM